jgi:hypothetical protein
MADTLDPKHLDTRTAERYLRSGQLDEKAYERYIKSLPDVSEKAAAVETAMGGEDFDTDEGMNEEATEEEAEEATEEEAEEETPEDTETP